MQTNALLHQYQASEVRQHSTVQHWVIDMRPQFAVLRNGTVVQTAVECRATEHWIIYAVGRRSPQRIIQVPGAHGAELQTVDCIIEVVVLSPCWRCLSGCHEFLECGSTSNIGEISPWEASSSQRLLSITERHQAPTESCC